MERKITNLTNHLISITTDCFKSNPLFTSYSLQVYYIDGTNAYYFRTSGFSLLSCTMLVALKTNADFKLLQESRQYRV